MELVILALPECDLKAPQACLGGPLNITRADCANVRRPRQQIELDDHAHTSPRILAADFHERFTSERLNSYDMYYVRPHHVRSSYSLFTLGVAVCCIILPGSRNPVGPNDARVR